MKDPLLKSMKKAYRDSVQSDYDDLLADVRYWQRKETIAVNKLRKSRERLKQFTDEIITACVAKGVKLDENKTDSSA